MDVRTARAARREQAYSDLYKEHAIDAGFFWLLRSLRIQQPRDTVADMAALEQRLADQLDGLLVSIDLGWTACEAALAIDGPGEVFAAAIVALHSRDLAKIQKAVQIGLANVHNTPGLISALGWLPAEIALPWIERLLNGKDMNHKYLGIAACSARRQDPGELLKDILQREDCRQHAPLYARALRLVGELRRQDLMPALIAAQSSDHATVRFWALWSLVLLGQRMAVRDLRPFVSQAGPHRMKAIQLAFRVLPIESAREWISALAQDPANLRLVITATGVLGDPHAVSWLIGKMVDPKHARLAAEAFTFITGIDLEHHKLTAMPPKPTPVVDAAEMSFTQDEDEDLPWPDAEKIAAVSRQRAANLKLGQRYFLGQPIVVGTLKHALATGYQPHRHAAALELALIEPRAGLINTEAKAIP